MNTFQSRRVVIAGGSGFLGVSLAYHLAAANWQVTILSRRRPRPKGSWQRGVVLRTSLVIGKNRSAGQR